MSGSFTACKTCFFATRDDREERFSCITCLANSRSLKTLIKEIHQQQENIDFTKAQISRSRPSPTDPHPPASILQDIAQLKAKLFLTSNTIHNLNCSIISRSTTPPISKTWTSIPIPTQTLTTLATTQSQLSSIQTFHTTQQKLSTQKASLTSSLAILRSIQNLILLSSRAGQKIQAHISNSKTNKNVFDVLRLHNLRGSGGKHILYDEYGGGQVCGISHIQNLPLPNNSNLYGSLPVSILNGALFSVASAVAGVEWVLRAGGGEGGDYNLPHPLIVPSYSAGTAGGGDFGAYFNNGMAILKESGEKTAHTYELGKKETQETQNHDFDDDFAQFEKQKEEELFGVGLQLLQHNVVDLCIYVGVEICDIAPPEAMILNLEKLQEKAGALSAEL